MDYSGDDYYDDEVTSGLMDQPRREPEMNDTEKALDELTALKAGFWSPSTYRGLLHDVTDETRATVRRVTGLTVREGAKWTAADCAVAATALREAVDYCGECSHLNTDHGLCGVCWVSGCDCGATR